MRHITATLSLLLLTHATALARTETPPGVAPVRGQRATGMSLQFHSIEGISFSGFSLVTNAGPSVAFTLELSQFRETVFAGQAGANVYFTKQSLAPFVYARVGGLWAFEDGIGLAGFGAGLEFSDASGIMAYAQVGVPMVFDGSDRQTLDSEFRIGFGWRFGSAPAPARAAAPPAPPPPTPPAHPALADYLRARNAAQAGDCTSSQVYRAKVEQADPAFFEREHTRDQALFARCDVARP